MKKWAAIIFGRSIARVLSVAKDHGKISVNVCERGGRLYDADRSEIIWQASDIREFCGVAHVELQAALLLALWTGQRQGDLPKLSWKNYDGTYIRLRQTKAKGGKGRRVTIPECAPRLRRRRCYGFMAPCTLV
jgi:integrase